MSAVRFSDQNEIIIIKHDSDAADCDSATSSTTKEEAKPKETKDGRFTVKPMDNNEVEKIELSDDDLPSDSEYPENDDKPSMFEAVTHYKGGIIQPPNDQTKTRQLGTLLGVYFPCIQNIMGVIVFIRYPWIIGVAGISGALIICSICSLCTFLTAISMSAIATNGRVPAGGSYFMISRSLGPAVGGAVGILFYIANSLSCAMYATGAVEILIKYICPEKCLLFGSDVQDPDTAFNHYRIYGTILLILLTIVVLIGIRFVSLIAPVSLFCVLFSVVCIYVGLVKAIFDKPDVPMCLLNDLHLLKSNVLLNDVHTHCAWNSTVLQNALCSNNKINSSLCQFLQNATIEQGVKGLAESQAGKNWPTSYLSENEIAPSIPVVDKTAEVYSIQLTNFFIMVGIYFPSVTGIMAGSNRSGDLKDPSKSIPKGTLGAILTTSGIYLTYALLVGSSVDGRLLRDKFGDSINKSLVISMIAWPTKWIILIGALLSTVGAGLQTLTGAPRILQALAQDNVIKALNVVGHTGSSGEPRRAVVLTSLIALIGVLIADIDKLTPLLSMFFLLCYGFVNMACALQSLLKTPNWRPTFKYYHWTLSVLGLILCIVIMFMASWYFALVALAVAIIVYKYIEYKGAEKEWGDGLTGLQLSAALYALSQLEEDKERHYRNWRPELLILTQCNQECNKLINDNILEFTRQLKAGGGLVIAGSVVITDNYLDEASRTKVSDIKKTIASASKRHRVKSFRQVILAKTIKDGIVHLMQTSGLGGMKPNTLVISWPNEWKTNEVDLDLEKMTCRTFIHTLRVAEKNTLAIMVPKNINAFPRRKTVQTSTIDIWWILHDAGLMLLIAYLLKKHKMWRQCALRIFTVAESANDAMLARTYIQNVLKSIRISCQHIHVVVLESSDISAYAYERTVEMEHGIKLLKELTKQRRALSQQEDCQFTFTPVAGGIMDLKKVENDTNQRKRIHSAFKINLALLEHSKNASLIIINLPPSPTTLQAEFTYMNFIEVLSTGLGNPILMTRGSGRELITQVG